MSTSTIEISEECFKEMAAFNLNTILPLLDHAKFPHYSVVYHTKEIDVDEALQTLWQPVELREKLQEKLKELSDNRISKDVKLGFLSERTAEESINKKQRNKVQKAKVKTKKNSKICTKPKSPKIEANNDIVPTANSPPKAKESFAFNKLDVLNRKVIVPGSKQEKFTKKKLGLNDNGIQSKRGSKIGKLSALLDQHQKKKADLERLKTEDRQSFEVKTNEAAWKKALLLAKGQKVKDDPSKIKASLKKERKRKKVSANKWKSRVETIDVNAAKAQNRRNSNIAQRKEDKKRKARDRSIKRGRFSVS